MTADTQNRKPDNQTKNITFISTVQSANTASQSTMFQDSFKYNENLIYKNERVNSRNKAQFFLKIQVTQKPLD